MASHPYRDRPDVERAFVRYELWRERLSIAAQVMSLLFVVVLVGMAVVCVLQHGDWRVVASLAAASAAFAQVASASRKSR